MRNRKKPWKSRAADASADALFERALFAEDEPRRRVYDPRADRKTLQLCRQVQRALLLALSGECGDELLRDVFVESVEPMGGASQLLVRVVVPSGEDVSASNVLAHLNSRSSTLRAIVAQAICRKRVPTLSFLAVPEDGSRETGATRSNKDESGGRHE